MERFASLRHATREETERVRSLLSDEGLSAWEITRRRYQDRDLPNSALVLALRETLAHLHHLTTLQIARREQTGDVAVAFARL
jgi:hypothetical protein